MDIKKYRGIEYGIDKKTGVCICFSVNYYGFEYTVRRRIDKMVNEQ